MTRHEGDNHGARFRSVLERTDQKIKAQVEVVNGLCPGSDEHRVATSLLLLLQDALAVLLDVRAAVEKMERRNRGDA